MDSNAIKKKFGGNYIADEHTFILGSDHRFAFHFAERFKGLSVLETCTGAGFGTIHLARNASHVHTIEINPKHQNMAVSNIEMEGLSDKVSFIQGDAMDETVLKLLPHIDAAFLDPDWAVSGPGHVYRFNNSNTRPPADVLLERILKITSNIALVLPPYIDLSELQGLPPHERESLFIGDSLELLCLYFGALIRREGETEFRVSGD